MIRDFASTLADRTAQLLLSPGSSLSLWSLLAALAIAVAVALAKHSGRAVPLRAMARAMFPRHRVFGASARADMGFTLLAVFVSSALFGWAVLSHVGIAAAVAAVLGAPLDLGLPSWLAVAAMTFTLWLAYEFAYWFDHLLSHKIPTLWAFHKVHHSAETLSPLTVFRVHPVDSIVFYNIVAVVTGVMAGVMRWLIGVGVSPLTVAGTNAVTIAAIFTIKHLHHSHVWISWRGAWGRLILSPAHHQIHHSVAPEHHDRNFGDTLAVFDWLAGTLHQPHSKREPLTFGVEGMSNPHGLRGALIAPFGDAMRSGLAKRVNSQAVAKSRKAARKDHRKVHTLASLP
ncbi:sterol desaturase family protein [Sphingomonas sp. SUN039]|uniref:sterol desaturase family protein n=1 Tax=Sphingomonas sp. SUN039 TaxID=2937787 RepID=UPI002164A966|nr:sterol desaturase family protein [Sphingomonas sp. SUN039]UVO52709.1 sterol desaturase family protein [Sphingomonas sp. SUN039]